ncbi:MAG TPA: Nramp family divalent metal transporter [Opitutaceae bacterium]
MTHNPGVDAPTRLLSTLRYVGPGLILTAGIVGTGELVLTPRVAAEHGFSLLWLIVLGCMVKVFVQIELGRQAVATSATTLQALDSLPGPRARVSWIMWIWLPVFIAMISVIGGILGGTAEVLRMAGVNLPMPVMVIALGAICSVLLGLGRYALIELACTAMVAVFIVATGIALVLLQGTEFRITGSNLAEGFSFRMPDNFASVFATFGLIGVGAAELIYYPYWCLEKGYAQRVGPRGGSSEAWLARARGWLRVMRVDAWCSMAVYTSTTAGFFLLGAAVLHAKGLKVSNADMIPTLAQMYVETFGPFGHWVFIVGAVATLYSTAFAGTASNARLLADALGLFGLAKHNDAPAYQARVRWCAIGLPAYAAVVYLIWPQPVTLIMISGIGQAILLPFLGGAAVYFYFRRLEPGLRSGKIWATLLWISAASLVSAGLWQLYEQVSRLLG